MRRRSFLWITGVSIAVVLLVFGVAAALVHNAIAENTAYQRQLRTAQVSRARLLRLQLDEETGVRGFAVTKDRLFLQPYYSAVTNYRPTALTLREALRGLSIDETPLHDEVLLNAQWNATVARVLIANPSTPREAALQRDGKALIDRIRDRDDAIFTSINGAAQAADTRSSQIVGDILAGSLIVGALLLLTFMLLAFLQTRLAGELAEQRRAYESEKRIADMLQEAFVRKNLPELETADLHGIYVPAGMEAKVGGDWYDAFELPDKRILFSIGDVAGHGIDAAVVMSRVRQAIVAIGIEEHDPSAILSRVNGILLLQDEVMVSAVCGFIDLSAGTVTYSTAGHPPIIHAHPNRFAEMLPFWGPPLGAAQSMTYRRFTVRVEPGSTLVLYTDGLVEETRDIEAGERRLFEAVEQLRKGNFADPAGALMEAIFHEQAPRDDVAILTISFRDAVSRSVSVEADLSGAAAVPNAAYSAQDLLRSLLPELHARR